MKKIYGFLGAVALFSLASCSNEGPDAPEVNQGQKGDLCMTLRFVPTTNVGSRTASGQQGIEQGKDYENKINDVLVIFAKKDETELFKAFHVGETDIAGPNDKNQYAATFEATRTDFQAGEYDIYIVANPSDDMKTAYTGNSATQTKVQYKFALTDDANGESFYWNKEGSRFLMSNAYRSTAEIEASDLAEGQHTTAATALDLGTVKIQRAMSRFDIDSEHVKFTENANNEAYETELALKNITIEFDGVALVNQATTAELFKVTTTDRTTLQYKEGETLAFKPDGQLEANADFVMSPKQTAYTLALFDGTVDDKATLGGKQKDFADLTYTPMSEINVQDETYTHPGSSQTDQGTYYLWRYCMEHTPYYDATVVEGNKEQKHGNTTAVVFRAKMTSTDGKLDGESDIYAYNNVFLGDIKALSVYALNNKSQQDQSGVYEMVNIHFAAAVTAYNAKQEQENTKFVRKAKSGEEQAAGIVLEDATAETLEPLRPYLVKEGFTVYSPDDDRNYYCYYVYYNRHNDNGENTQMGQMEFATVRNNVYKLRVTAINKLGHPGDPDDDPDPDDPDDPDEEDHFYFTVSCEILPWEVRINGIVF
ncbi:MAG: Mfa1 fimbrilin C-terminal domain-containing protein [Muribaculaceae bacterium]|nr:Mfa1 fimbrilin C-terminal domain-containing protein [Muribaculaceae bacterium]